MKEIVRMELLLTQQSDYQVDVACDKHISHTFDLQPLRLLAHWYERISHDPISYGQLLFQALFPVESQARHALDAHPERIVLVATDDELDTLPWEYLYGPDGFLVLEFPFVRGLPSEQRIAPPTLDTPLHIVAVPSNPLSPLVDPLNIDAEWRHLKEVIDPLPFDITLERVRPPTLQQVQSLIANKRQRIIHFMGHGGQIENGAFLCFEKENGDLDLIETKELIARIRGTTFLITLNACVSASPGPTVFSNLAASIAKANVPYALGMRFRIYDDDALAFSYMFYTELAQGTPVEKALLQARRSLAKRPRTWAVGVPVLYTSLSTAASGFVQHAGTSYIDEHQPHIKASNVARAIGTFQGRTDDLKRLGSLLTGDNRPRILTIHGGGGQGKTALAREAIERFAYAWPGGIWGIMLDPLPDRPRFVNDLAQFLGINVQEINNQEELERLVLLHLASRRILLVLDNAETLVNAIEANDPQATVFAEFLQQLPGTLASLLITSRIQLGWSGEITHELGGLTPEEGALLFRQGAPERLEATDMGKAQELSKKIEGHPLGLRLLAGAFNASTLPLHTFIQHYEEQLVNAENKYVSEDHRHRQLYASIETSIRYLKDDQRNLLSNLWIFQAPFLPDIAHHIFDSGIEDVHTHLRTLWQRGLLARITVASRDGSQDLYYLLPTTRPYIQTNMHSSMPREELLRRYGEAYEAFTIQAYTTIDHSALVIAVVQQMEKDLEQGIHYVADPKQRSYRAYWAWIIFHSGKLREARTILEDVLEQAQGQDQILELQVTNYLGQVYQAIGQPQHALKLFEQVLPVIGKVGNRADEAGILYNIAKVYQATGQPQRALELFEQALPTLREIGRRADEAATLSNIAGVYQAIGQPQRALDLFEQALPIIRAIGRRADEAATLNNIAGVYQATGQLQRALDLFEQALSIQREIGNRAGEAAILSNIARVYGNTGQPQRALDLFEQAISIQREAGDRAGEATTLHNIGLVYQDLDQLQHALELLEQALPIRRETGDRAGEAATLSTIASMYRNIGKYQYALELLEQALPIRRETGDRAGEAATLHNMAAIYQDNNQSQQALSYYEQALSIRREISDRAGEAVTLNNIAGIYQDSNQPQRALSFYEQALPIFQEVADHVGEASILNNMGNVYKTLGQSQKALKLFEQALLIRRETNDHTGEAAILNSMAEIYQTLGQLQRALTIFEQVLTVSHKSDDLAGKASILNNMGKVHRVIGQPQRALTLFEQALSISREISNRAGEAVTLNNIGLAYQDISQPNRALNLFEQALSISREVGNRDGEATTLNNMGQAYQALGQLQQALSLFEQALSISRAVNDRTGEATTLNNIGLVHRAIGQPQRALSYYEQALPLMRKTNNRTGEATTLSNMARIYHITGQLQYAISFYEQALPIIREVGDRVGEITTLNNAGLVYRDIGQPQQALPLYEQALSISRKIGRRSNEASILNNMARAYQAIRQPQQALPLLEQALSILREAGDHASEAATLNSMAFLLYGDIKQPQEALHYLQQARQLLEQYGLQQDAAGNTLEKIDSIQKMMQQGLPPGSPGSQQSMLPSDIQQQMIINTIAVMTKTPEQRTNWHRRIETFIQESQAKAPDRHIEIAFYISILDILDGKAPSLALDHPYASAITAIQNGIARRKVPSKAKKKNQAY